jgi:hypothetical protein
MRNFNDYIIDVKSQLWDSMSSDSSSDYVSYVYSAELVDNNLEYFKDCMSRELSTYKALLFFEDYLSLQESKFKRNI